MSSSRRSAVISRPTRAPSLRELLLAFIVIGAASALGLPYAHAAPESDLGTVGPVYPVVEPDMLRAMEAKLREKERTGELARLQREAVARSEATLRQPRPVDGLARAIDRRVSYVDPTVTFATPVIAPDGSTVVPAGASVNPLDYVALSNWLLFFDARDPEQIRYAAALLERYQHRLKPILVGGSFVTVARAWQRPVYYDQGGALVRRLGIRRVPALVSQEGRRLRIEELVL
jgi:conjugal transfer pilus assembly protein TraW